VTATKHSIEDVFDGQKTGKVTLKMTIRMISQRIQGQGTVIGLMDAPHTKRLIVNSGGPLVINDDHSTRQVLGRARHVAEVWDANYCYFSRESWHQRVACAMISYSELAHTVHEVHHDVIVKMQQVHLYSSNFWEEAHEVPYDLTLRFITTVRPYQYACQGLEVHHL